MSNVKFLTIQATSKPLGDSGNILAHISLEECMHYNFLLSCAKILLSDQEKVILIKVRNVHFLDRIERFT